MHGRIIRIDEVFPNGEERRKIVYTLMFWSKKPVGEEQREIGSPLGSSVRKIVRKLSEEGLFSIELESIFLYRYIEKMRPSLKLGTPTGVPGKGRRSY